MYLMITTAIETGLFGGTFFRLFVGSRFFLRGVVAKHDSPVRSFVAMVVVAIAALTVLKNKTMRRIM